MRWVAGVFGLLALGLSARADESPLPITSIECALPSAPGACSASLARGADGLIVLSWIEPGTNDSATLRFATFDAEKSRWSPPRTVAQGHDWAVNNADRPSLAIGRDGHFTAVWLVNQPPAGGAGHHGSISVAQFSQSTDYGVTWSAPQPLSRESRGMEFPAIHPLADGRVLAAWLDGRNRSTSGAQQLYARVVGADAPDQLVDASVCDCCLPGFSSFPDGSALLAYRGRTREEIRDIRIAKFQSNAWSESRDLHRDDWRIAGCPVNGPQLSSCGGRAGIAWFTAANGEARVLVSFTPDAGTRWLDPLRVDRGHPLGHVGTMLLADGSLLVTWIENGGDRPGLWVRRIAPNFQLGDAALLAPLERMSAGDYPKVALLKDYDATPAQFLVAFAVQGETSKLRTLLVTLPDRSALVGRKPCIPCDEAEANAARGYPVHGKVLNVNHARSTLLVHNWEIPGVMREMTLELHASAELISTAPPGREFFGRIERRGREWWLIDAKWLGPGYTR